MEEMMLREESVATEKCEGWKGLVRGTRDLFLQLGEAGLVGFGEVNILLSSNHHNFLCGVITDLDEIGAGSAHTESPHRRCHAALIAQASGYVEHFHAFTISVLHYDGSLRGQDRVSWPHHVVDVNGVVLRGEHGCDQCVARNGQGVGVLCFPIAPMIKSVTTCGDGLQHSIGILAGGLLQHRDAALQSIAAHSLERENECLHKIGEIGPLGIIRLRTATGNVNGYGVSSVENV